MMGMSTVVRPDNLLIALVFDKQNKMHVNTIVGHYSEFLPEVNLLDKHWTNQFYREENGYFIVLLHNCIRKRSDFKKVFEYCFHQVGLQIDILTVFNEVERLLWVYTMTNGIGKPIYPVTPRIKQDAIKTKLYLIERRREFDLASVSTPNFTAPMALGSLLRNVAPIHRS